MSQQEMEHGRGYAGNALGVDNYGAEPYPGTYGQKLSQEPISTFNQSPPPYDQMAQQISQQVAQQMYSGNIKVKTSQGGSTGKLALAILSILSLIPLAGILLNSNVGGLGFLAMILVTVTIVAVNAIYNVFNR